VLVAYTCHIPNIKGMEGERPKYEIKKWYGALEAI